MMPQHCSSVLLRSCKIVRPLTEVSTKRHHTISSPLDPFQRVSASASILSQVNCMVVLNNLLHNFIRPDYHSDNSIVLCCGVMLR
jgi:hypothetical protein